MLNLSVLHINLANTLNKLKLSESVFESIPFINILATVYQFLFAYPVSHLDPLQCNVNFHIEEVGNVRNRRIKSESINPNNVDSIYQFKLIIVNVNK